MNKEIFEKHRAKINDKIVNLTVKEDLLRKKKNELYREMERLEEKYQSSCSHDWSYSTLGGTEWRDCNKCGYFEEVES